MKSYYAYTMHAYRKSPTLFRTVPSPTPYGFPFPKIGGSQPQLKIAIAIISGTGKARDCNFGRYVHRVHPNKDHEKFERKAWAFTKLLLITNRNSDNALSIGTNRPWMTFNCCKFNFSRNFALVGMFGRQRMKLDPHCQRGNCCALKVLFNDV